MRSLVVLAPLCLAALALVPASTGVRDALEPATVYAVGPQFVPGVIVVPLGAPVTWVYTPPLPHTITTTNGAVGLAMGAPNDPDDSNCLVDGEEGEDPSADTCMVLFGGPDSFTHTFTRKATFFYYCNIHRLAGGMVGVVQVV